MGLGPNGSSLLERLGRPTEPGGDTLWIQIDQQQRGEARAQARMRYQQKHKAPKKPEAPVEPLPSKAKGQEREWWWRGETIMSKGLVQGDRYFTNQIRAAGFKLPRLEKKPKKAREKE